MNKIKKIMVEPSKIEVGSTFLLKIEVYDILTSAKFLVTEQGKKIITEDNKPIRSEWGG